MAVFVDDEYLVLAYRSRLIFFSSTLRLIGRLSKNRGRIIAKKGLVPSVDAFLTVRQVCAIAEVLGSRTDPVDDVRSLDLDFLQAKSCSLLANFIQDIVLLPRYRVDALLVPRGEASREHVLG